MPAATRTEQPAVALTSDQLAQIIGEVTKATQVAQRPENTNAPPAFWNGHGLKGFPTLKRRTYFCGALEQEKQLTKDEIDLYNAISKSGTYGPGGKYRVRVSGHGDGDELSVSVVGVDTMEGRMGVPSLKEILSTIVSEQGVTV